jgi:peptidylglycine monooxygenase
MAETGLVVALAEHQYAVERPWGRLPAGMRLSFVSQVAVDRSGNVYVCQRSEPPVVVFGPDGEYLRSWGSGQIADAHGIAVDPSGASELIWIVDRDAHQLLAFEPDGRLARTLGERHRPSFQTPFNHPTSIAVAPDGELYVADGYGNSNVHRFTAGGAWLASWGTPGEGAGQFTTPHAVWVDPLDRVLVADRENNRIQVFSRDGEFQGAWGDHYHPMALYVDDTGYTYVTDQIPRLSLLDSSGRPVGRCRPVSYGAHGMWGDRWGNLFLAEASPMDRLTKLALLP